MKASVKIFLNLLFITLLASCGNAPAGDKVEAGEAISTDETTTTEAIAYEVSTTSSSIEWIGSKLDGSQHTGTIGLNGGTLMVKDGNIVGGSFELDMNSITDTDLTGEYKEKLEGHLKSGDFFEVEKYPTGKFEVVSVSPAEGKEGVSHDITGNLTLKGITKSVVIPAKVELSETTLGAKTITFTIDRTEWDIKYNSGLLGTAKDKIINDDVALVVSVMASPQQAAN